MTTYISAETARKLAKLILICFGVMLVLWGYVLWQVYEGRVRLVNHVIAGCERDKLDRADNAKGWRTQQNQALSNSQPWFASTYSDVASSLEERAHVDCHKVFPKASLLP